MLVMQVTGQCGAKRALYLPYYASAKGLIRQHHLSIGFEWIPRKQNSEADELAKKALIDAGVEIKIQGGCGAKALAKL